MISKAKRISANPPLTLALSFAILILLGGLLLSTPYVTVKGNSVGLINGLFTAASALCVTGLTVVPTASVWNTWGHLIIITFIQIGGLGIMTLATMIPIILSKKIGLTSRQILKEELNFESYSGVIALLKYVFLISFTVEALGAIILAIQFVPDFGFKKGLWYSVFHSISAYCNAGFDILGDSIVPYKNNLPVNIAVILLVVIGGLGFQVIVELLSKRDLRNLSVHSKLVLTMTGILIIVGTGLFWILEKGNTLVGQNIFGQGIQSLFQSVITRTAGFYSIDSTKLLDETAVLFIILMFIGGSPGSTAGGLKTTTFGVLFYSTIATIRGDDVVIYKKEIPKFTILKSLSLVTLSIFLVVGLSFILTIFEPFSFLNILFEVTSAYGTVGLTRGITSDLSSLGKMMITITMYLGRIGPLTFAYAIGKKSNKSKLKYPKANITVG